LIISYLATFLGTNSLSVLMCRKAVNQSINQSINLYFIEWRTGVQLTVFISEQSNYIISICLTVQLYFYTLFLALSNIYQ